jgi:hypothetical protein
MADETPQPEVKPQQPRAPRPARPPRVQGPTLTQHLDQLGTYAVRDLLPDLGEGLERHFPDTAAALPKERWRQVGWTLAGLLGVYWLVGLGPELAQSLVWLGGIGVVGYTGWHVMGHWRRTHRDETARRFAQHAGELRSASETERIAALAALDQLGYDNPRYRLALVSLLMAWLAGRSGGHDVAVAVQMVAEFRALLAETVEAEEPEDEVFEEHHADGMVLGPEPEPVLIADEPDEIEAEPVTALEVIPAEAETELAVADAPEAQPDGPAIPQQRAKH